MEGNVYEDGVDVCGVVWCGVVEWFVGGEIGCEW